jgi:hypothetical protein
MDINCTEKKFMSFECAFEWGYDSQTDLRSWVARSTEVKGSSQEYLSRRLLPLRDLAQKGRSVLPILATHGMRIGKFLAWLRDCIEQ